MSDAANNALLFEEEIDRRVLAALGTVFCTPSMEQEAGYLLRAMMNHPVMREYIYQEVEHNVKQLMLGMYPRGTPEPFNPRMEMYRKKGFSAW